MCGPCIERERGLDYDKYILNFKYQYFSIKTGSNVEKNSLAFVTYFDPDK